MNTTHHGSSNSSDLTSVVDPGGDDDPGGGSSSSSNTSILSQQVMPSDHQQQQQHIEVIHDFDNASKQSVERRIGQYIRDIFNAVATPSGNGLGLSRKWKRVAGKVRRTPASPSSSSSSVQTPVGASTVSSSANSTTGKAETVSYRPALSTTVTMSSQSSSSIQFSSFQKGGGFEDAPTTCGGENGSKDLPCHRQIDLGETLACIQFNLNQYVKSSSYASQLDPDLMSRLCSGLLLAMGQTKGSFLHKQFTPAAQSAFSLFGQFIEEVATFCEAVSKVPTSKLCSILKPYQRFKEASTEDQRLMTIVVLHLVVNFFSCGIDWQDLVSNHRRKDMSAIMAKYTAAVSKSCCMPKSQCPTYPPQTLYYDRPTAKLATIFGVDINTGLDSAQVEARSKFYGNNTLPKPKPVSTIKIICEQLTDFMVLLLFVAIITTSIDKDWKSAIVLAVVIIINTIVGSWQNIKANQAISALNKLAVDEAQVLREGVMQTVEASELVPGAIVALNDGDRAPADSRLIECSQFEVIESLLTGESEPAVKDPARLSIPEHRLTLGECTGNAFMSSIVSHGHAKGIVVRVGLKTEIGKISAAVNNSKAKKTPIQRHLQKLGLWLIILAICLCALIVILGVAWGRKFLPMFISGLSLAVSVVPEGLVAVTTITMAFGVRRMAQHKAIVRVLPSVETLGSVTIICSDKTGTLTEGKMCPSFLVDSFGRQFEFTGATSLNPDVGDVKPTTNTNDDNCSSSSSSGLSPSGYAALSICSLCNNAQISFDEETKDWVGNGDPTEVVLLSASQKARITRDGWNRIAENPFDSDRKTMSTVYEILNDDSQVLVLSRVLQKSW